MPASYAIVMAGGSGTRFWPRSRATVAKQFLALAGSRSLLQDAVARVAPLVPPQRVLVVTGIRQAGMVRRQLPRLPAAQVVVEPLARNTAVAIALVALRLARRDPTASMVVVPADHVVGDVPRLRAALRRALRVARTGALVTLGIAPTRPETGYGYLRTGRPLAGFAGTVRTVDAFVEKPSLRRARALLAGGNVLWNSGMFVWRADRILEELRRHLPQVVTTLERALAAGTPAALAAAYRRLPAVSIDHGVMERADRVAVVEARLPWSDVGSWAAAGELWSDGRRGGNALRGRVVAVDSSGCVVDSPSRLVALVGMDDVVVVDSADALLVCRKDRAQDVRRVVAELQRRGLRRYL